MKKSDPKILVRKSNSNQSKPTNQKSKPDIPNIY